ncbi:MAG: hypothetical protein KF767_10835 [Bdellovibrionaceae bacterium]|nr:hypothetical protein [Pseudobdellovibrionaceae bacterium]
MSFLKTWLKDLPDPAPRASDDPKIAAAPGLNNLVEFINRKRDGQNKRTEADLRRRAAALKVYEKVKRGA